MEAGEEGVLGEGRVQETRVQTCHVRFTVDLKCFAVRTLKLFGIIPGILN